MSSKEKIETKEIPQIIIDPSSKKKYQRGKFLGKGGFAKCYELTDVATQKVYAGKIVSKSMLMKQHQKEKMSQEIAIHRSVKHKNIVGFHGFFEDKDNVYVILELCRRRSMMELHKRRKAITEPETRYFIQQLLLGVKYLHDQKVIHRDLKLGNLFLNDDMELKIGDFGLATRVDYEGERKRTLCGTPNYIAPEVLGKKGHSFEVDVWSLGCILYTLLVGKPPFETQSLKDTYVRIKKNEYTVPSSVAPVARSLISKLLQSDPVKRPTIDQILEDGFMTLGYIPTRLPTSCLTTAPRFDSKLNASVIAVRKPLLEINNKLPPGPSGIPVKDIVSGRDGERLGVLQENAELAQQENAELAQQFGPVKNEGPTDCYLKDLFGMLTSVNASKPAEKANIMEDEAEDPAAVPMIWVSKWVDYSDKYGLGYQLCDDSIGVLYNDSTKLLLLANGEDIHYIEREGRENYHTITGFPSGLNKKVTLLKYFRNYMKEHLVKAGAAMKPRDGDELSRIPCLRTWFRTRSAIVLHLTNGTLQINFFQDHTKIILCPLMGAVTYIDERRTFRTFRLSLIEQFGCNAELASRLRYARTMVERLMNSRSGSARN